MFKNFLKAMLLFCATTMGLFGQEYTNYKGSAYKFEKIHQYDALDVESQGKTGTCWSFSSLSFFESELMRLTEKSVAPLSEMYIVRKAYELKAEKFIRMDGKTNFAEGGAFHDIPLVMNKFGIVPRSAYNGNSEDGGYDHGAMYKELNDILLEVVNNDLGKPEGISLNWKTKFNLILDKHLGKTPNYVLTDSNKKITPQEYAKELQLNMNDYVSLTSFTNHPFYKPCMLEIPDNWAWGKSYNLPLEQLVAVAKHALEKGYTMAWGADVSEKGFNFRKGLAIVPATLGEIEVVGKDNKNFNDEGADKKSDVFLNPTKELNISQEFRQTAYDNKTTTDDHGMHITGLYKDQNGTNYFFVKNSWGKKNYPEGYLYVSENYFKYKTINIFLHKDALPEKLRKELNL